MNDLKPLLLEIRNASKTYGNNTVLTNVSFHLKAGETVAIIGQNGAGKSTLSKIIAGVIEPNDGCEISIDGKNVNLFPPRNALNNGIAFIPQELSYVPEMTVAENIMLGRWPKKNGVISYDEMLRQTKMEATKHGIKLNVEEKMTNLKLAEKQLVEILKALTKNAKIILLDEPTASLTENESENLFNVVSKLSKEKGVGVIYISHRMDEVFKFSDRVDVLRNGKLVASQTTKLSDHQTLIYHMLGQKSEKIKAEYSGNRMKGNKVFSLLNWSSNTLPKLNNIGFDVYSNEIVGVFGVRGCGAEVIAEGIVGLNSEINGKIELQGRQRDLFRNPIDAKSQNIAYVPPDRKKQGLVLNTSIKNNISLPILKYLSKFGLMNFNSERVNAQSFSKNFNVRSEGIHQNVDELSGGNQQKVLLSSRLAMKPMLFVLQEPTRGVDIGARLEIHKRLREIAKGGTAILVFTSDIDEAIDLCDRLIIIRDGIKTGELIGEEKRSKNALKLASSD